MGTFAKTGARTRGKNGVSQVTLYMKKQKFTQLTCVTNHGFYVCVCSQSKYSKQRANSTLFKYDDFTFFSGSWDSTITMWNIEQLIK